MSQQPQDYSEINMGKREENFKFYTTARYLRFYFLVACVILFFGLHNYLQELIMSLPNFKIAVILAYLEVLGVTICSYVELKFSGETARKSPLSTYITLCFFLMLSSAASNLSLNYINYPVKVVFRSCKIIPTLSIASCLNQKKVYWFEYLFGALISIGMILFATADMRTSPSFSLLGIVLVSLSVISDAFLPNFQGKLPLNLHKTLHLLYISERVFDHGSSRVEVTFYTNILCLVAMTVSFFASGDLQKAAVYAMNDSYAASVLAVYTFLAYIAIFFHMSLVQEFGGITAVLVGNFRKALTIVLSFVMFPKLYHPFYVWGGILVFGSLTVNAFMKESTNSKLPAKEGGRKELASFSA